MSAPIEDYSAIVRRDLENMVRAREAEMAAQAAYINARADFEKAHDHRDILESEFARAYPRRKFFFAPTKSFVEVDPEGFVFVQPAEVVE